MTAINNNDPMVPAGSAPRDSGLPLIPREPSREGFPDGAWCPRSADLVTELGTLIEDLRAQGLEVRRVVYNPELWGRAPRRAVIGSRPIDLGTSRAFYPHLVRLFLRGGRPWIDLLVIFPTGHGDRPATAARVLPAPPQWHDLTPQQVWEDEGGHLEEGTDTSS
ncbi:MAG: DUF5994 family protein [Oryzihumus sp.]